MSEMSMIKIGRIRKNRHFRWNTSHGHFNLWFQRYSYWEEKTCIVIPMERCGVEELVVARNFLKSIVGQISMKPLVARSGFPVLITKRRIKLYYPRRVIINGKLEELKVFIKRLTNDRILEPVNDIDNKIAKWERRIIAEAL